MSVDDLALPHTGTQCRSAWLAPRLAQCMVTLIRSLLAEGQFGVLKRPGGVLARTWVAVNTVAAC